MTFNLRFMLRESFAKNFFKRCRNIGSSMNFFDNDIRKKKFELFFFFFLDLIQIWINSVRWQRSYSMCYLIFCIVRCLPREDLPFFLYFYLRYLDWRSNDQTDILSNSTICVSHDGRWRYYYKLPNTDLFFFNCQFFLKMKKKHRDSLLQQDARKTDRTNIFIDLPFQNKDVVVVIQ